MERRPDAGLAGLVLVAVYVAAGAAVYAAVRDPSYLERLIRPAFWEGIAYVAPFSLFVVLCRYRILARGPEGAPINKPGEGWRIAWRDARRGALSAPRLRYVVTVMLVAPLFFNAFTAWKALIPVVNPFFADVPLARLDILLHGGLPDRLLTWLPIGWLDFVYYYVWTEVLVVVIAILAWYSESRILLALTAAWILLGTVVATVVSSAGPPYYLALSGHDLYGELFRRLAVAKHGGPVIALEVQRSLWRVYTHHELISGTGISAFPSMHVAVPSILMYATWGRSRVLSAALGIYTGVIFLCSVALGWHYAVDGYVSLLGTGIIWAAVSRFTRSSVEVDESELQVSEAVQHRPA